MNITWPATLPLPSIEGYGVHPGEAILRTEMEAGPARQRRRYTQVPSRVSVRWIMRRNQLALFESWYDMPKKESSDPAEAIERADEFVAATGAEVKHGGEAAYYRRTTDHIQMPPRETFTGTDTSTSTEGYYSTLLHELTHWTGHKRRIDRDMGKRFGDNAYAMEELVAELGAAFLSAELGITQEPRPDHAAYLDHWLKVMKADKKAIFTAASQASKAADYLGNLQPQEQEVAA